MCRVRCRWIQREKIGEATACKRGGYLYVCMLVVSHRSPSRKGGVGLVLQSVNHGSLLDVELEVVVRGELRQHLSHVEARALDEVHYAGSLHTLRCHRGVGEKQRGKQRRRGRKR